jgi:hypothetical protein
MNMTTELLYLGHCYDRYARRGGEKRERREGPAAMPHHAPSAHPHMPSLQLTYTTSRRNAHTRTPSASAALSPPSLSSLSLPCHRYPGDQPPECTHAYALSLSGARKFLAHVDWCARAFGAALDR